VGNSWRQGEIHAALLFRNVVAQFIGSPPFVFARLVPSMARELAEASTALTCHCEATKSAEAISAGWLWTKIAAHLAGARNDKKRRASNGKRRLMNQATTKI
jgi:hypothetical protein